jgi:hypothetical protein
MKTPQLFVASAPDGAGLSCAIAYLVSDSDAYGWFVGRRQDGSYVGAYFLLEDLFANAPTAYEAVGDVHDDWGLDEAARHELAAMQDAFASEWLVFSEGRVSVHPDRLGRLSDGTFHSPEFSDVVLRHLTKHWPLEYRPNMARIAAARERRKATHARP